MFTRQEAPESSNELRLRLLQQPAAFQQGILCIAKMPQNGLQQAHNVFKSDLCMGAGSPPPLGCRKCWTLEHNPP